ncbi:MAG: DEAD/DEAH box helicase, partial [Turicibacter sp.]
MTFNDLQIHPDIMKAIEECGYQTPTLIQEKAIPALLSGKDLLGCAKTGTGKTAAFAIPSLQKLLDNQFLSVGSKPVRALILAPTRELALQIGESFEVLARYTELQVGVLFGGVTPKRHIKVIKREPDIIVATPGRLLDFVEQGHINADTIDLFVLDEADQMLDEAMLHIVKKIIRKLPKSRQNMLFSATMPNEIMKLANSFLKNPIKISAQVTVADKVEINQQVYYVEEPDKT